MDELSEVEGFFEDAAGAEEFCNVKEVLLPLRTGHGDDLRIEIFPRQLQCGFEAVGSRHQNVHEDEIHRVILVEGQALPTTGGFEHTVASPLKDFLKKAADRFFVVDYKNSGHRVLPNIFCILPGVGFFCLEES